MALAGLKTKLDALMVEDELMTTIGARRKRGDAQADQRRDSLLDDGGEEALEIESRLMEARRMRHETRQRELEHAASVKEAGGHRAKDADPGLQALRYELRKLQEAQEDDDHARRRATRVNSTSENGGEPNTPSTAEITPVGADATRPRRSLDDTEDALCMSLSLSTNAVRSQVSGVAAAATGRAQQERKSRGNRRSGDNERAVAIVVGGDDAAAAGGAGRQRSRVQIQDVTSSQHNLKSVLSAASSDGFASHRPLQRHGGKGEKSLLDHVQQRIEAEKAQQAKHAQELEAARAAAQAAEEYEQRYSTMRRRLREQVLLEVFGAAFEEPPSIGIEHSATTVGGSGDALAGVGVAPTPVNFAKQEFQFLSANPLASLDELIAQASESGLWAALMHEASPLPMALERSPGLPASPSSLQRQQQAHKDGEGGTRIAFASSMSSLTSDEPAATSGELRDDDKKRPRVPAVSIDAEATSPPHAAARLCRVLSIDEVVDVMSEGTYTQTGLLSPAASTTPVCTSDRSTNIDRRHRDDALTQLEEMRRELMQLEAEEAVVTQRLLLLERQGSSPLKVAATGEVEGSAALQRPPLPFVDKPTQQGSSSPAQAPPLRRSGKQRGADRRVKLPSSAEPVFIASDRPVLLPIATATSALDQERAASAHAVVADAVAFSITASANEVQRAHAHIAENERRIADLRALLRQ